MGVEAFFIEHHRVILFYSILIGIIIIFRSKIEWQTFGIGLYKTKWGIGLMDRWGKKYQGLVQLLGLIGIGVGFTGMGLIVVMLLKGLWGLITDPSAPAVVQPVIPGVSIPGFSLTIPLIAGWLALFIVVVIHEFSHGVVSRAHDIPVKSSGLLIFGPIGGAFVEPDEKTLEKKDSHVKYALFAAGPFSNLLTAGIFFLILMYVLTPLTLSMSTPMGVEITAVTPNYPAANASIEPGMVVTAVNGVSIIDYKTFSAELDVVRPGEAVTLTTDKGEYAVVTIQNPTDQKSTKGYLGINLKGKNEPVLDAQWFSILRLAMIELTTFFFWLLALSIGLGLGNLLPLGPVDGGQMLRLACRQVTGDSKKDGRGDWWWGKITIMTIIVLLTLLLVPFIRSFL